MKMGRFMSPASKDENTQNKYFQKGRQLLRLKPVTWRILTVLIFGITLLVLFAPAPVQAKGVQAHAPAAPMDCQPGVDPSICAPNPPSAPTTCQPGQNIKDCVWSNAAPSTQSGKLQNPLGNGSTLFFYTPLGATDSDQVETLWKFSLGIVDAFIVLSLALSAIRMMLAGTVFRYADAVEQLPGTLLALIAANLSLIFVIVILGINNAMSVDLLNWVSTGVQFTQTHLQEQTCTGGFVGIGQQCSWHDLVQDIQITPANLNLPNIWDALSSVVNLTGLIIKILAMMLLAQIIIRLFLINLYIVTAPLGIASWALPGKAGQPLTRLWLHGFLSTVMVQFLQVLALIVAQVMLGTIMRALMGQGGSVDTADLANILAIAVLWFILRIPSLLGTASLRMLGEAGQAMSQAAGAALAASAVQIQSTIAIAGGAANAAGGVLLAAA